MWGWWGHVSRGPVTKLTTPGPSLPARVMGHARVGSLRDQHGLQIRSNLPKFSGIGLVEDYKSMIFNSKFEIFNIQKQNRKNM
jgi:hypothetical protein